MEIHHFGETTYVRFSDFPESFDLSFTVCDNPECDCRELHLRFKALTDENPIEFALTVDVDSWTERRAPVRNARIGRWASEFLDELPDPEKHSLYLLYDSKFAEKRLQNYNLSIDDVNTGALVSYTDIVSENRSFYSGGTSCISRLKHNGNDYVFDALYCPNPKCHCNEAHLYIARLFPDPQDRVVTIRDSVLVKMSFDGKWQIKNHQNIPFVEAKRLLTKWLEKNPQIIGQFKKEYRAIKEVGRRSLERAMPQMSVPLSEPIVHRNKIGRNDPCICGSGKKYKKCCGA